MYYYLCNIVSCASLTWHLHSLYVLDFSTYFSTILAFAGNAWINFPSSSGWFWTWTRRLNVSAAREKKMIRDAQSESRRKWVFAKVYLARALHRPDMWIISNWRLTPKKKLIGETSRGSFLGRGISVRFAEVYKRFSITLEINLIYKITL